MSEKYDHTFREELAFFITHWGKTKSMVAMSKKLQYHGIEKLYRKNPRAFWLFFVQYLTRDTFIYVLLPLTIASVTV